MNRLIQLIIAGGGLWLAACAHHPGNYNTYSANNGYYPNYPPTYRYPHRPPSYPKPVQPYRYRHNRPPYPVYPQPYPPNTGYPPYYQPHNDGYPTIRPWPDNGHHHDHSSRHHPSPYRYQQPYGNWRDRDSRENRGGYYDSHDRNDHNRFGFAGARPNHRDNDDDHHYSPENGPPDRSRYDRQRSGNAGFGAYDGREDRRGNTFSPQQNRGRNQFSRQNSESERFNRNNESRPQSEPGERGRAERNRLPVGDDKHPPDNGEQNRRRENRQERNDANR